MASNRVRRVRAGVFALALLLPSTVFAQQISAADREQARGLMEAGDAKREKGDLPGALESFQKADGLVHVPTTGLEVARVQQQLGKIIEARDTAARVAKLPVTAKEPAVFKEARKQADALAQELAGKIATLSVIVSGADTYAVTIDGEAASNPESPHKINPGKHTIVAKGGGNTASQDITLGEGEVKKLPLELKATTDTSETPTPPTWQTDKTTDSNDTGKALMWGGFGVGAVGIAVGAITGVMSLSKVSDVKPDCPGGVCPASRQNDIDSAKTLGTVSTVSFIVGGIGVAVGIAGVVMSKKDTAPDKEKKSDKPKEDARIEPVIGLGYAGLRGTF